MKLKLNSHRQKWPAKHTFSLLIFGGITNPSNCNIRVGPFPPQTTLHIPPFPPVRSFICKPLRSLHFVSGPKMIRCFPTTASWDLNETLQTKFACLSTKQIWTVIPEIALSWNKRSTTQRQELRAVSAPWILSEKKKHCFKRRHVNVDPLILWAWSSK